MAAVAAGASSMAARVARAWSSSVVFKEAKTAP